jgi:hypothetical protein
MDKRHKGYNRRDARQPLTALTALGLGQTMFGLSAYPSRLVELASLFLHRSSPPRSDMIAPLRSFVRRCCVQIQHRPDCIS